jgi:hypothetical protein
VRDSEVYRTLSPPTGADSILRIRTPIRAVAPVLYNPCGGSAETALKRGVTVIAVATVVVMDKTTMAFRKIAMFKR